MKTDVTQLQVVVFPILIIMLFISFIIIILFVSLSLLLLYYFVVVVFPITVVANDASSSLECFSRLKSFVQRAGAF